VRDQHVVLSSEGREQKITWGDNEATDEQIVAMTAAEERLIYDFDIHKTYGQLTT
jgi:hypothetical protein